MASSSRRPPGGKRKRTEDDLAFADGGQKSLTEYGFSKKRKKNQVDDGGNKPKARKDDDASDSHVASSSDLLAYLLEAKQKMQKKGSRNGVTYSLMGSSGCGKSTVLKKIFLDGMYSDDAQKKLPENERQPYVVSLFTESEHSDALDEMPKDVTVFPKGIDVHAINWCYRTNSRYDKRYNFVLLSDDCIHIRYSKMVEKMFLTMRNSNITSAISLQYPKLIPLSVRTSVYFSLCFLFNNEEGIEQVVRGWLAGFLPGANMREKMDSYRTHCMGGDGHRFFLLDNLNHKCFKVFEDYSMEELPMQSFMDYQLRGPRERKRGEREQWHYDEQAKLDRMEKKEPEKEEDE